MTPEALSKKFSTLSLKLFSLSIHFTIVFFAFSLLPAEKGLAQVSPEKALNFLISGNTRFVQNKLRKDGISNDDRQRLTSGQHPNAIIISCSDSRVPPELIFDQKLGEIFVVRGAGEGVDSTAVASVEYAVEHLGVKLVVVLGHESCGAVKTAFETLGGKDAGSPALNKLVADIQPRIKNLSRTPSSPHETKSNDKANEKTKDENNKSDGKGHSKNSAPEPSKGFISEAKANARGVVADLIERSEILKEKAASGAIQIKSAIYYLGTGKVEFF